IAAWLAGGGSVDHAGIDRGPVSQLESKIAVIPRTVASIILQELIVTYVSAREQLDINAGLVSIQQRTRILKQNRVGALVNAAEGRSFHIVACISQTKAH